MGVERIKSIKEKKLKHKFSIVFALVLAVSLMLVPAAVSADVSPAQFLTDGGTAEWSTAEHHTGSYSAKLTATNPGSASVGIPYGGPLSAITELSFWYNHEVCEPNPEEGGTIVGPDMVLVLFDDPTTYIAGTGGAVESTDSWSEADATTGDNLSPTNSSGAIWWYGTCKADGSDYVSETPEGDHITFAALKGAVSNATVLYVGVKLDPPSEGGSGIVYVDDITINDVVYELEAPSSTVSVTATSEAAVIGISVLPTLIDFGSVESNKPVTGPDLTITNIGNVSIGVSAEITADTFYDGANYFYNAALMLQGRLCTGSTTSLGGKWEASELNLESLSVVTPGSVTTELVCPPSINAGTTYTGTVVFWAEATE